MAAIAKRAGVVASVIYDHFPSKRNLYIELLEMHGEALIDRAVRELPTDAPPPELLRMAMEGFYGFVEENPFAWRFLFRDPPTDPQIAAVHTKVRGWATEAIAALIESVAAAARIRFPISRPRAALMLAEGSRAAVDGLAGWWYDHREVPRRQVVEIAARLLWQGLGGILASDAGVPSRPQRRSGGVASSP